MRPDTGATSETYRTFLGRYLPELHEFLVEEGIAETSVFHVSDEPHNEDDKANYIKARALLRELAPWMKTMDAIDEEVDKMGNVHFGGLGPRLCEN